MKKRAVLLSTLLFFTYATSSFAELSQARKDLIDAKFNASSAADSLKVTTKLQKQIVALKPTVMRNTAIMMAAGLISTKLNDWGMVEIKEGRKTQEQMMYVMGLSLMKLAHLAQAANLNEAQVCHFQEAHNLIDASQGKPKVFANCRQDAYSTEMQADSIKVMYLPEMKNIQKLVNDWATNTALLCDSLAKLDKYGAK